MTRFAYLVALFGLALALVLAFFDALPSSPFGNAIADMIAFLGSESVHQGLAWLSWCFPIANVIAWIPAFINALIAFFTARGLLFVLSLHA